MTESAVEPLKVHLAGSDLPLTNTPPVKVRRGASLRTFTLTANDPVQQILPQNANRIEAYIQATDNDITVYTSKADALAGGGGGIAIPAFNRAPYPMCTTDPLWATSVIRPTTVCVSAIIEGG